MRRVAGLLACTAWVVLAARPLPGQGATGVITGSVADSISRQPVVGAVVSVAGTSRAAATNVTGHFVIDEVPTGTHDLSVKRLGYASVQLHGVVVGGGAPTHVEIRMSQAAVQLERVQVAATKEAVSVGDAPVQTDIVGRQQIDQKGDLKLTQALANVPGLLNSALEGSFESVQLRGLPRTGNEWTTTLLLIDGIPQTDSRNSARVINLPITDVQDVEVVRGPNSALYGRQAIGGTVDVITADPTLEPLVTLSGDLGAFDYRRIDAKASGPLKDWGGYLLSWGSRQDHGFYRQSYDFNDELNTLYGKVTFSPDSKSHGFVSFNNVVTNNGVPTPLPIVFGRPLSDLDPRYDRFSNINIPTSNYHQEELRTTLNYRRQLANRVDVTEVFGYRKIEYRFDEDGDVLGAPFDTAAHTFTMYPFAEKYDEHIYYQELRFGFQPRFGSIENSILIGGSYEYNKGFGKGDLIYTDTSTFGWPLDYLDPVYPDRSTWQYYPFGGQDYSLGIIGLYFQDLVRPVPRLILTVGGRYDRLNLKNKLTLRTGQPSFQDHFEKFDPKLGATLKLLENHATPSLGTVTLNLYGNYSKAYLPPRVPSGLSSSSSIPLNPEDVWNYEGGFKATLWDGKVAVDGDYFRMNRNGIVVDTRQGPFYNPTNAGQETFRGVELSIRVAPSPELAVYANAAIYKARFGAFIIQSSSGDDTLSGNHLPVSPDQMYNAGATWQSRLGFGATANLKRVGAAFLDQGNVFRFSPYTVVDGSVFWTRRPVRLTLSAHNLFNERYFTMGDIENAESADPAAPRQVVVSTSFELP